MEYEDFREIREIDNKKFTELLGIRELENREIICIFDY